MAECVFCKNIPKVMDNALAYAVYDINPLSKGHALVIPRRHFNEIFEATPEEFSAMQELLTRMKILLDQQHGPHGYNIWINCGAAAGQVVMHAHMHLIPRYQGEVLHIREHLKGNIE
ncbi:MAG: HIT family protein [Candidatus Omnitrophota bacterium]